MIQTVTDKAWYFGKCLIKKEERDIILLDDNAGMSVFDILQSGEYDLVFIARREPETGPNPEEEYRVEYIDAETFRLIPIRGKHGNRA
jgi:hypothetical protein